MAFLSPSRQYQSTEGNSKAPDVREKWHCCLCASYPLPVHCLAPHIASKQEVQRHVGEQLSHGCRICCTKVKWLQWNLWAFDCQCKAIACRHCPVIFSLIFSLNPISSYVIIIILLLCSITTAPCLCLYVLLLLWSADDAICWLIFPYSLLITAVKFSGRFTYLSFLIVMTA